MTTTTTTMPSESAAAPGDTAEVVDGSVGGEVHLLAGPRKVGKSDFERIQANFHRSFTHFVPTLCRRCFHGL